MDDVNIQISAVDHAKTAPYLTIVFEAGNNKLVSGYGKTHNDKPCLGLIAAEHAGELGTPVIHEAVPTALVVFHSKESVDLMMSHLKEIRKKLE
jgi:hypothetical protein